MTRHLTDPTEAQRPCPRCGQTAAHERGDLVCDYGYAQLLASKPGWMLATSSRLGEMWEGEKEQTTSRPSAVQQLGLAIGFGWAIGPWQEIPASAVLDLARARTTKRQLDAIAEVISRLETDDDFRQKVEAELVQARLAGADSSGPLARAERSTRPARRG